MTTTPPYVADREALDLIAEAHQWLGGYYCACGQELNSPSGFNRHLLDALIASGVVRDVASIEALVEKWRYKGEFGWGAWQEGFGPDIEGQVLDQCASELAAALGATR